MKAVRLPSTLRTPAVKPSLRMRLGYRRKSTLLQSLLLLSLLVACMPARASTNHPPPTLNNSHNSTEQPQVPPTEPAPATVAIEATSAPPPTLSLDLSPVPTRGLSSETPDFITTPQETSLISDWRPPLYPIPWAPTLYDHFFFASPIAADEINTPLQDYRYGGMFFENVVHTGIDIPAPRGTPVLAAGPGTVIWAGYGIYREGYDLTDPYGLAVTIQHDFGYKNQTLYTIYGHLNHIDVTKGQHVETGDVLGLVGETGKVTGPHLHFEVRLGESSFFNTRNPELWLVPPMGWGVIAGRVMTGGGLLLNGQMIIITNQANEENSFAWSYGETSVNSDEYYQENLVAGDIPAGEYLLRTAYGGVHYKMKITVSAGMVSYFTFRGYKGFSLATPPLPGAEFTPAPLQGSAP